MGILGGLSEAEPRIAELEAELALARPVLAAAEAWVHDAGGAHRPAMLPAEHWLVDAVIEWRAAREG